MSDTPILFSAPLRNNLGNRTAWGNLPAAARALAIAEAALQHKGLSLVITRDTAEADRLEQELRFFAPQLPITSFPDWETLPYDRFSPHQDIISQRLETLYRLPQIEQAFSWWPRSTRSTALPPRTSSAAPGRWWKADHGWTSAALRRTSIAAATGALVPVTGH